MLLFQEVIPPQKIDALLILKSSLPKDLKPSTPQPPTLWCYFLRQNRQCFHRSFGSLNQLCLTTKPSGAVKSCELPWRWRHGFHHQICRVYVFCWVAYFTPMRRKFIERDNQTRMGRIETEHVNYVFGLGGEIRLVWICHFFFPVVSCSARCHEQ